MWPFFDHVFLGCLCNTGNGNFLRDNGVNGTGKAQLHRPTHLTTVQVVLDEGGHHRSEGTDIIELPAHKIPNLPIQLSILLLGVLDGLFIHVPVSQCLRVRPVQRNAVLDIDAVALRVLLDSLYIITDLPFQADVGHQAVAGLRVQTGHIARVGVTVGIAVFHVKQDDEFIAVLDWLRHVQLPPSLSSHTISAPDDSSPNGMLPAQGEIGGQVGSGRCAPPAR